ncbi:MAG: CusA/CzcA family heavy metal efflux RND transporter [Sandaracinaceae bacterium]
MIERIVDFSVRNRFLVILFVLAVGAMGVRAARELPIDAVPDVTNVQVQVLTQAPALGPLEIERFITFPVESVMSGLPQLEEVRSVSRFGLSAVTLVFEEGTDIYFARQLVQERLAEARESIPSEYGTPEMGPVSSGLGEIYMFEVRGDPACEGEDTPECWSLMELREVLDWTIAYQLRSVDGVVEVNTFGGELKTYEVQVDPVLLRAFGLGLNDVFDALERNNVSAGGGYVAHAGEQRLIRADGLLSSLSDVRAVVVSTRDDGTPIRIADIGDVHLAPMIRQGGLTRDGRGETVSGIVMMLIGANSREVSRAVDERIDELRGSLPEGVTIDTYYDRTELVDRTVRTAATNLIEGGVLVIVVLLLLLGNMRGGLLVAAVIPLSMLAALIGMNLLRVSGNLMSLGALDLGILVDGAVVVVEHVVLALSKRKPPHSPTTIRQAAREVARPVLFAVSIIMLVYVPILTLQGIEGKMFRPMAITVLLALGASVVLALTLMPAASTFLFAKVELKERETWLMRQARRVYEPLLDRALGHPAIPIGLAMLLVVGAGLVAPTLGAEFVPRLDEGAIAMHAMRLPSVSLEESVAATTRVEQVLLERFPDEVRTVVSRTGRPEIATDPMGVELSDIYVLLHPPDQWTRASSKEELVAQLGEVLEAEVPGQAYAFSQPIEMRTNELLEGVRADVAILIYGDDLAELARAGDVVSRVLGSVEGAEDVLVDQVEGLPFLNVIVDRTSISRYGVDARDVTGAVSSIAGHPVGTVFEGQRRFALQVRLPESSRSDVEAIRRIPIALPNGGTVPLGELATVEEDEGPASVGREAVRRRLTIQVNVRGRDVAGFVSEAQERIRDEVDLPDGYFIEWGGQFENLQEATERLAIAVPVVLLLIFVLLYLTYGAARPAALVYLNVPIAATGGVFALAARGMPFSISAAVGFIALFGIAVLNGVVLVSTIRDLQKEGGTLAEATSRAARARLRPILMTALTDALGFLPMAVSTSAGAEVQRPLATVVIGGLVTCTLLTLFVLPAVYARLGGAVTSRDSLPGLEPQPQA